MRPIFIYLALLTSLSSCTKKFSEPQNEVSPELYGEYHWEYTQRSGTDFIDKTEVSSLYSIRINEDGLFYVKDGDVVKKYKGAVYNHDDITGSTSIIISNNSDYEIIKFRDYLSTNILDVGNFPFETSPESQLKTGNYFKLEGTTISINCNCNEYRDTLAGAFTGWYTEKVFTGFFNNIPQFDTVQRSFQTINLNLLKYNNVTDTAACIYLASHYYTDTLYISTFLIDPIFSDYDWYGDFGQNHGKDYEYQSVTKLGNSQVFEFYTRDMYINQSNQAIAYYPIHFAGSK